MAGAGISTGILIIFHRTCELTYNKTLNLAAGIPDFRSPKTGFYDRLTKHYSKPENLFKIDFFQENPAPFFFNIKELLPGQYKPTVSHFFIRLLHEKGVLLRHYTQNIDSLELFAGIPEEKVVEAHGTFRTSHCMNCKREYKLDWLKTQLATDDENFIPKCRSCKGVVKPDTTFFGEDLPDRFYTCSKEDFPKCDLLIILGTSLVVHPFSTQVDSIPKHVPRLLINRHKTGVASREVRELMGYSKTLDFSARSRNVAWEGDCDKGCLELAAVLGWADEFQALLAKEGVSSEVDEKKPVKLETQEIYTRPKRLKLITSISFELQPNLLTFGSRPHSPGPGSGHRGAQAATILPPLTYDAASHLKDALPGLKPQTIASTMESSSECDTNKAGMKNLGMMVKSMLQELQNMQQFHGAGYISEKLYCLLQLYLQNNKSWNPAVDMLQCLNDLKDASLVPSAAYLQMLTSRITLDNQARLILRDSFKIILPFEHYANAVMLKHMNGPQGMHLGIDATIRAVMESYTVGREHFGMDKEFIVDVVQNCPNPACRFYKMDNINRKQMEQMKANQPPMEQYAQKMQMEMSKQHFQQPQKQFLVTKAKAGNLDFGPEMQYNQPTPPAESNQQNNNCQQQQSINNQMAEQTDRLTDLLRANLDSIEGLTEAKDFLSLHNGLWPLLEGNEKRPPVPIEAGQEKIVRTFGELMKNMARMKTCVRPSMCKPYGKQSESLQKTLVDTIQLIQSLRSFLPPPHITVTSWKEEEHKHRPGAKSALRTLGKQNSTSSNPDTSLPPMAAPPLMADNLQHLVRPKGKYE
ncbi:Hypothetical predicted protein [Cloeon dipterum]|uniref:Deacetylase sirtuin-type domain-containing protein n=1 Tax=Cloeon dipterum TaxID=197152 RepID=A0A8S1D4P3_9INSE|nr:Hypothetical predicted protein [Cloeon dipterum]